MTELGDRFVVGQVATAALAVLLLAWGGGLVEAAVSGVAQYALLGLPGLVILAILVGPWVEFYEVDWSSTGAVAARRSGRIPDFDSRPNARQDVAMVATPAQADMTLSPRRSFRWGGGGFRSRFRVLSPQAQIQVPVPGPAPDPHSSETTSILSTFPTLPLDENTCRSSS